MCGAPSREKVSVSICSAYAFIWSWDTVLSLQSISRLNMPEGTSLHGAAQQICGPHSIVSIALDKREYIRYIVYVFLHEYIR